MRIGIIGLIGAATLTSCGPPPSPSDDMTRDEAVAAVESAQDIPPQKAKLEVMSSADFAKEKLAGASCAFMPEGTTEIVALAMEDIGAIKLGGRVLRLAPDAGSGELPYGIRERFDGLSESMVFVLSGEGEPSGLETTNYDAQLTLTNPGGQVIYEAEGIARCGV